METHQSHFGERFLAQYFIIFLEEVPSCLKEGIDIPVYKGKGKDPLSTSSYLGITLSSVIAKTLEVILLKRMSPILDELSYRDINQTAFQRGISCADAIFSTQEVLLNYIRQGDSPFFHLRDIDKSFDEFPILLQHLHLAGINGKSSNHGITHLQVVLSARSACLLPSALAVV